MCINTKTEHGLALKKYLSLSAKDSCNTIINERYPAITVFKKRVRHFQSAVFSE